MEEADKERALKEVSEANLRDLGTTLATAEWRAAEAKSACTLAEQRAAGLEGKLGEVEMKLAQVESVISARNKEMADLKAEGQRVRTSFTIWGLLMPRTPENPSWSNLSGMGSGKDGWLL